MREELDKLLCEKYPKMLVNRYKSKQESCMYWGFMHGDGWFTLIERLMANIQQHIDWKQQQRDRAIKHNQAIIDAQRIPSDWTKFDQLYPYQNDWVNGIRESIVEDRAEYKEVPEECPQVVLDQVKEKMGSLRFYYTGGDDYIHGMVRLAESLSESICESCGDPGTRRGGGWIHTYCDPCEEKRNEQRNQTE